MSFETKFLLGWVVAVALVIAGVLGYPHASLFVKHWLQLPQSAAAIPSPPTREELLTTVNAQRSNAGAPALTEVSQLDNSAQQKADDMQARNYYDHPDPDGKQGYTLAQAALPSCTSVAEILAGNQTASGAVSDWLNSPEHKGFMLDAKYNYTGFGVTQHDNYYYVVEHLCEIPAEEPAQPTGLCNDGTPTYAQNHQGACSWHHGVEEWYK